MAAGDVDPLKCHHRAQQYPPAVILRRVVAIVSLLCMVAALGWAALIFSGDGDVRHIGCGNVREQVQRQVGNLPADDPLDSDRSYRIRTASHLVLDHRRCFDPTDIAQAEANTGL